MSPNYLHEIWAAVAPALVDHVWQSTAFAGVAALVAVALRKSHARARYWIWLAASLKFLVPFSLFIALGGYFAMPSTAGAPNRVAAAIDGVAQTCEFCRSAVFLAVPIRTTEQLNNVGPRYTPVHFLPPILLALWLCGLFAVLAFWLLRWRRTSRLCREATPLRNGREVEALRRLERTAGIRRPLRILQSPKSLEPGIFGIFRPVLLWPRGFSERLDDAQLESILAHELLHVRRRDNLAAFVHMLVEAIFWFHPLVWWLGGRLVDERERACDEGVLETGSEPKIYAESVLKACEYSVAAPAACISGVTGSDLKKRIVRIMTNRVPRNLGLRGKLLLAFAASLALAMPIGFGLARGKPQQASPGQITVPSQASQSAAARPKFEVVSIKPDRSGSRMLRLGVTPGRFSTAGTSTKMLIMFAYNLKADNQIVNAPKWINSDKYDIDAKEDDAFAQKMRKLPFDEAGEQIRVMVQSMLADRFKLKVSHETKELPIYALIVAKNGPKLTESKLPPPGPIGAKPSGPGAFHGMRIGRGGLTATGAPISLLASILSRQPELGGRVVVDETGLKGSYDFTLKWTPEFQRGEMAGGPGGPGAGPGPGAAAGAGAADGSQSAVGTAPDSSGPSLFTALQQQLGLRLKPTKGPVDVLVIDHVEPPTPN